MIPNIQLITNLRVSQCLGSIAGLSVTKRFELASTIIAPALVGVIFIGLGVQSEDQ